MEEELASYSRDRSTEKDDGENDAQLDISMTEQKDIPS